LIVRSSMEVWNCKSSAHRSAPSGRLEGAAYLGHALRRQRRNSPAECLPRNRVEIVEVDDAVGRNAVRLRQCHFRDESATRSGQRGDHDRADSICNGVTGQYENRSVAA